MHILHVPRHERVAPVRHGRIERELEPTALDVLDPWRLVCPVRPERVAAAGGAPPQVIAAEDGALHAA